MQRRVMVHFPHNGKEALLKLTIERLAFEEGVDAIRGFCGILGKLRDVA